MFDRKCIIQFFCLLLLKYIEASKNIILILTDDLDLTLDGMTPLKNTVDLIGQNGITFENAFVSSPICCPNRASILTGRYMHNTRVTNNSLAGNCNSLLWQSNLEKKTFANIIKTRLNYTTFYAGKYLNKYGSAKVGGVSHVPPGWDWWNGLVGNSKYYNYSLSINGKRKKFGKKNEDYLTDVIANFANHFILRRSKKERFLMVLAPPAPHAPFTPAKRHRDKFRNITVKRTPNFNALSHKEERHWLLRLEPVRLTEKVTKLLDIVYRRRWETLLAVDDLVSTVYRALKSKNILDDTYMIFTSDNGYHIGQFGLAVDKRQPYETDIRVPLLIRGPHLKPSKNMSPVSTVDLFATILDMAGLEKPSDGKSLLRDLSSDRTLLIEYKGERSYGKNVDDCPLDSDRNLSLCSSYYACKCHDSVNNTFSCIRRISTKYNSIFCHFKDDQNFLEFYNLKRDPYQMENTAHKMERNIRHQYHQRLLKLRKCKKENCIL